MEKFWGSPDFKAIRYEIHDLGIKLSKSGDVAWFFCILDDINEWKGKPSSWENTRWTGVLEKREGRWVIVYRSTLTLELWGVSWASALHDAQGQDPGHKLAQADLVGDAHHFIYIFVSARSFLRHTQEIHSVTGPEQCPSP